MHSNFLLLALLLLLVTLALAQEGVPKAQDANAGASPKETGKIDLDAGDDGEHFCHGLLRPLSRHTN
jgi:hypothetical protein